MLVELSQIGSDEDPQEFDLKMQAYNMGTYGDKLSVDRFADADCTGDATTVADGSVPVQSRWD